MYADNLRQPYELRPGELVGYVRVVQAIAKLQDRKPPPEPNRARCA